ncbi:MAG: hypothetical protein K8F25_06645, partial [Fimbriimonadaceae bacterium]|nr:hypothetical protein [Alphaproteobacteria bacterium]
MTEKTIHTEDTRNLGASADPGSVLRVSLLRFSGMIVGARISGAVFGLLTQILLAKFLGAEDIGVFFVTIGLAAILSIVSTMGYP